MRAFLSGIALAAAMSVSPAWGVTPAPPPVEVYGKLPAIDLMSLSPSGKRFAFVAVQNDARKLFVETIDNKPLAVAALGSIKVRSIDWAGDDHVLITTSGTVDFYDNKFELFKVAVLNLIDQKIHDVFFRHQAVSHAVFCQKGVVNINSEWFGYFCGFTDGHYWADLYRVDLDRGDSKIVGRGSDPVDNWVVNAQGEVIARATYQEDSGTWAVFSGAGQGKGLATGHLDYGGVELGPGRATDRIAIFSSYQGAGAPLLREVSLDGVESMDLPVAQNVRDHLYDPLSNLWIGYVTDGDDPSTTMFDPASQAKMAGARKAFPDQHVTLESWSTDFNTLIVFTSGGGDSGTYWLVDIKAGKAKPLGADYPAVKAANVGPSRMFDWKAADGLPLRGVLTLPPGGGAKGLPVVVMPHGGPEARDYTVFDWWAQAFAARGYAVFQPNFRGSSGYGLAFRNAGFGQWGRKMQTDITDGLAELGREGIVDPKRACIVGASYGGYAALAGVTVQQGFYRCAVSYAGISDLPAYINDKHEHKREAVGTSERYVKDFLGVTDVKSEDTLKMFSPALLSDRADAPVLLIHGLDDTVVPLQQSLEMNKALTAAGKPVELITLPGADHWMLHEDIRVAMVKASVAFVEKHNPAGATTAPSSNTAVRSPSL